MHLTLPSSRGLYFHGPSSRGPFTGRRISPRFLIDVPYSILVPRSPSPQRFRIIVRLNTAAKRNVSTALAVLFIAGLLYLFITPDYRQGEPSPTGKLAPDFALTIDGKPARLSDFRGKVVFLNFWATWCPPCRKEMPDLQQLSTEFRDRGLVVIGISDEPATKVQPFVTQHAYTYTMLLDPGRSVNDLYKIDGIPKTFLYDRHGRLVGQAMDMRTRGQLLQLLKKAGIGG